MGDPAIDGQAEAHGLQQGDGQPLVAGREHKKPGMGKHLVVGISRDISGVDHLRDGRHLHLELTAVIGFMVRVPGNHQVPVCIELLEGVYQVMQPLFRHQAGHGQKIFSVSYSKFILQLFPPCRFFTTQQ